MFRNNKERIYKAAAICSALIVWQAAAMILNHSILLASPIKVVGNLVDIVLNEGFWGTVWFSLYRIAKGFLFGLILGIFLAVVAGRYPWAETLIFPYMVTIKTVPVASFIVIALIWLSSKELSVFISFLIVLPVIYNNVLTGIKNIDPKMQEMADVFRLSWGKKLMYIFIPHLKPYLLSACSVAIGLAWKSGVAAEIIGIPDGSLGEVLYEAKVYINTADLLAWTVVIVFISVIFEKVFMHLLNRAFTYWENRSIDGRI